MSWFKELYGYEAEERSEAYPALETPVGKTVVVEFMEEHPRVITTSYGQRAVINVKVGADKYSLWLSRIGLAREIALLEKKVGSLKGVKAKITNTGKQGRAFNYKVELIPPPGMPEEEEE